MSELRSKSDIEADLDAYWSIRGSFREPSVQYFENRLAEDVRPLLDQLERLGRLREAIADALATSRAGTGAIYLPITRELAEVIAGKGEKS